MFVPIRTSLLCLGLTAAALQFTATPFALAQRPYQIVDHWKIGGTGGWDYLFVDPAAHLIYVTHGPRVEVIDANSGKVIAAITGLKGTHGDRVRRPGQVRLHQRRRRKSRSRF